MHPLSRTLFLAAIITAATGVTAYAKGGGKKGLCTSKAGADVIQCVEYSKLTESMVGMAKTDCEKDKSGGVSRLWTGSGTCPTAGVAGSCKIANPAGFAQLAYYYAAGKDDTLKTGKAMCTAMSGAWMDIK